MESSLKAEQDISGTSEETQDDKQVTSALAAIGASPKSPFVIPIKASLSAGYSVSNLFLDASGIHWTKLVIFNLTEKLMTPGASWFDSGRLSEKSEWGLEDGGFVEIPYKGYTVVFSTSRSNPSTGSSGYLYYKIGDDDKVAIAFSNSSTEENAINVGRKGEDTWKWMTTHYDEFVNTELDNDHYAVFYNQSSNPHTAVVAICSKTFEVTEKRENLRGASYGSAPNSTGVVLDLDKYIREECHLHSYQEERRNILFSKLCKPMVYYVPTIIGDFDGDWLRAFDSPCIIQIINLTNLTFKTMNPWFDNCRLCEAEECELENGGYQDIPDDSASAVCVKGRDNASFGWSGLLVYNYGKNKNLYVAFNNPTTGAFKMKVGSSKEVYDETEECYEKVRKNEFGDGIFARYKNTAYSVNNIVIIIEKE